MNKKIFSTAFRGVALAMGIAVIVLNILGTLAPDAAITLLSIGLTSLAIAAMQKD